MVRLSVGVASVFAGSILLSTGLILTGWTRRRLTFIGVRSREGSECE
jgi:hypothetical protein